MTPLYGHSSKTLLILSRKCLFYFNPQNWLRDSPYIDYPAFFSPAAAIKPFSTCHCCVCCTFFIGLRLFSIACSSVTALAIARSVNGWAGSSPQQLPLKNEQDDEFLVVEVTQKKELTVDVDS